MLKKRDYLLNFLNLYNIFICPICHKELNNENNALRCENNHTFDYTAKGTINLIKTSNYKSSPIYNKELFYNRRSFIKNNFYYDVYVEINKILNNTNYSSMSILDVGCGESTHSMLILEHFKKNYIYYGFDYSSDAINIASDYISDNNVFFKASVDNIPIKDNSIDVILDFLSPYNEKEFHRVLKKDGIIIKISPSSNYLKELRTIANLGEYQKEKEVYNTIENRFEVLDKKTICKTFSINKEQSIQLIKMTPMNNLSEKIELNKITIDLNIYVLKVKK